MLVDVAILGCGWAGITIGYYLLETFPQLNVICIDKHNDLGGLLRSENINGFIFDTGGSHIIFSRDESVLRGMLSFLEDNVVAHNRKAFVYIGDGIYVPYPFENGIWILPSDVRAEILIAFIESLLDRVKNPSWVPRNLREWIYGFFGRELARFLSRTVQYEGMEEAP